MMRLATTDEDGNPIYYALYVMLVRSHREKKGRDASNSTISLTKVMILTLSRYPQDDACSHFPCQKRRQPPHANIACDQAGQGCLQPKSSRHCLDTRLLFFIQLSWHLCSHCVTPRCCTNCGTKIAPTRPTLLGTSFNIG